ncbi:MAG: hypothetical protein IJ614_02885 [Prevotella sp.]|nr:hypothetical protein [Prevotella sp.]
MKKFSFFLSAAALMFAGAFTSCSNEDNATGNGTTEPPTAEVEVEVFKADFTYDFAAAYANGEAETLSDLNGNASKGQAFYAWESASKTDSKRQDYKGYTFTEGSVLASECHVWRRQDKFKQTLVEAGLNCTRDGSTFAIDGLEAGSIVKITYDGSAAAEGKQSIIWTAAINAETGVRSTAKINGVEAVSGETAIESGAEIEVLTCSPTDNGTTGYITVGINKGMVIQKIEIGKVVKEKKTVTI